MDRSLILEAGPGRRITATSGEDGDIVISMCRSTGGQWTTENELALSRSNLHAIAVAFDLRRGDLHRVRRRLGLMSDRLHDAANALVEARGEVRALLGIEDAPPTPRSPAPLRSRGEGSDQ